MGVFICLALVGTATIFPKWLYGLIFLIAVFEDSSYPASSYTNTCYCLFFKKFILVLLVSMYWYNSVILLSLMIDELKHF